MDDGSMSAEEYLRRSAELTEKQEELRWEKWLLKAHAQKAAAAQLINVSVLGQHFRAAAKRQDAIATVLDFDTGGRPCAREEPFNDYDLQLRHVHNMPGRARCAPPTAMGHHSASEPMRQQMETGAYPTLEAHQERTSVAHALGVDDTGHIAWKQLTKEDEDAFRTRKN